MGDESQGTFYITTEQGKKIELGEEFADFKSSDFETTEENEKSLQLESMTISCYFEYSYINYLKRTLRKYRSAKNIKRS